MDITALIIWVFLPLTSNVVCRILSGECPVSRCTKSGNLEIQFPFRVKSTEQPIFCGYSGFDVWCDMESNKAMIELPYSGSFRVSKIDYTTQEIWVNDPENCLPKRLLGLNLSVSPFWGVYYQDFSFFNCSNVVAIKGVDSDSIGPIPCLSGPCYSVYALPGNGSITSTVIESSVCSVLAPTVKVPVPWPWLIHNQSLRLSHLTGDILLKWFMPCQLKAQAQGSRKGRKTAVMICILGLLSLWIRRCIQRRIRSIYRAQISPDEASTDFQPLIVWSQIEEMGLALIEDNSCSICMAKYRPNDKMGILPMCRHYFHAHCITKWLISCNNVDHKTKTCPICRAPVAS